jgi:SAM-dependent methyltransferase
MLIDNYHSTYVLSRRVTVLARHLATLAPQGGEILDVGCGDGQVAKLLLDQRTDLTLSGVDVLVRERTVIPVVGFNGTVLPFADATKDGVMFVDVLHHTNDPLVLLREAARVSRRWILIKDHHRDGLGARLTLRFMDWIGNAHHGVALPYNYWSASQWQAAFAELKLRPVRSITSLGLYPGWANWLFGRRLHFITLLEKQG